MTCSASCPKVIRDLSRSSCRPAPPGWPEPGAAGVPAAIEPDPGVLPRHTTGPGLFTIPHGPVRSGVVESMEYLVETPGEDIPHLNMRIVLQAPRDREALRGHGAAATACCWPSGPRASASVAHALAYCQAIETIAGAAGSVGRGPDPGAACRARAAGLPPGCHRPAGRRSRACGRDRAVRLAQGTGAEADRTALGQQVRPRRRRARRGEQPRRRTDPADMLAAIGSLDTADHRRHQAADGHRIVPGPAAPDRPAATGAGRASMARSVRSDVRQESATTPGRPGPTPPTDPSGMAVSSRAGRRRPGQA